MLQKYRKSLFFSFLSAFILIGVAAIYYSQGFRIDFETLKIHKTGAVYIETRPNHVEILINGKLYKDKSNMVKAGTLILNILPKKYRVVIKKEGFRDFERNIQVEPSKVFRIKNIILVPEKIQPQKLAERVDGDVIIDVSESGSIITKDSKKNVFYLSDKNAFGGSVNLSSKISSIFSKKISDIRFHPQNSELIIALASDGIYKINLSKKEVNSIIKGTFDSIKFFGNNMYAIKTEKDSKQKFPPTLFLTTFDLSLNSLYSNKKINGETQIKDFGISGDNIFSLSQDGKLSLFRQNSDDSREVAHSAELALFSPDGNKLIYKDKDGKAFVLFLEEDIVNLDEGKDGLIRLNIADYRNIKNMWQTKDSYHVFIKYPQKFAIAEITQQEPNNIYTISENENIFYKKDNNKLYYIADSNVYEINLDWQ